MNNFSSMGRGLPKFQSRRKSLNNVDINDWNKSQNFWISKYN